MKIKTISQIFINDTAAYLNDFTVTNFYNIVCANYYLKHGWFIKVSNPKTEWVFMVFGLTRRWMEHRGN